jgi:hypothetical protein
VRFRVGGQYGPSLNGASRLEPSAKGLGRCEESGASEWPGRPGCDDRFYGVARDTGSSGDLFDRENVRENRHQRSAGEGKSLASSFHAYSGQIRATTEGALSPPAVKLNPIVTAIDPRV